MTSSESTLGTRIDLLEWVMSECPWIDNWSAFIRPVSVHQEGKFLWDKQSVTGKTNVFSKTVCGGKQKYPKDPPCHRTATSHV